jgi:UDP-N-acetyl-D-mannosaminuronate dehydrogenase
MDKFKETLLKSKLISVWGAGYLGYTKILKLQSIGFKVNIFDITNSAFEEKIHKNRYPDIEQIYSWSQSGNVPLLDASKINIIKKTDQMFASNVHILAFPVMDRQGNNLLRQVADIFCNHKDKLEDSLIIFQSAATPGVIDRDFVEALKDNGSSCSFVTALRSDWTIEEFLSNNKKRILAANDKRSLAKAMFFYYMLGTKYKTLSTIKEAEIYENARNSFQYAAEVFINQLALAYPDTNIRVMTEYLLKDIELNESHLSIGAGGYKMPYSVQNIFDGSKNPDALSLIKEVQNANLGMILSYAEMIKKIGCSSATLLGISTKGNQKSIDASPALILAEYLGKLGMEVYVDDPFYNKKLLSKILPRCKNTDIFTDKLRTDALFVMIDHNRYKFITQDDICRLGINNAKVIIDNVPLFKEFKFSHSTVYHAIGDGKIGLF